MILHPNSRLGEWALRVRAEVQLALWQPRTAHQAAVRVAIRRVLPFTMLAVPRLRRLADALERVVEQKIPGVIVECGCWRGGSAALLDWTAAQFGVARPLQVFDSFAGLPPPGDRDGSEARLTYAPGWCLASPDDVEQAASALGRSSANWAVHAGWLEDTLPRAQPSPIALLHVDVDWYNSVAVALHWLYDRVVPGGIVVIDDYGRWRGCTQAVEEFLEARAISRRRLVTGRCQGVLWTRDGNDLLSHA